ncbi:eukaryotic porin-domain-containing protein [Fimicolochytrium jonesii]|uniref:eukaryotic porin-domain-containing protein n=1 Tax=Fimicolochytrium jonesii TaxID=1396493 RepID=UPI0022FDDDBA|nr:eukaryotic porin-domain-containing protein [Fimicolochytrium jonesii]KAI8826623.1 eukaryotic porin-domain-containing protein [Fimicolochytrium jonesii]
MSQPNSAAISAVPPVVSVPAPRPAAAQGGLGGIVNRLAAFRQRMNLSSPGNWESLHRELKMVQPTNFLIEGAKFDLTSVLSPNFTVFHSFAWGSAQYPPTYHFGSVYAAGQTMLHGQIDDQGGLQARAHYNWATSPAPAVATEQFDPSKPAEEQHPIPDQARTSSTSKVTAHLAAAGGQNMVQLEHDHIGTDYSLNVKAMNPNPIDRSPSWGPKKGTSATGVYQLAYLQSVTPSIALGTEFVYQRMTPDTEDSALTFAFKYAPAPTSPVPPPATLPPGMPSPFPPVDPKAPSQVFTATYSPATGLLHSSYWRRLSQRLEVCSELQLLLTPENRMGPGRREGLASVGFKLDTINSTIRGMIDTTGRLSAVLEERIVGGIAFQLSGEIDYAKGGGGQGRVGLGFVMEA